MKARDVIYVYDGSITGFYNCVYESVYEKELPQEIYAEQDAQPTLFETKYIESNEERALRVRASVPVKISARALELIESTYLSYMPQKELKILRFLLCGYKYGARACNMLGHEDVSPLIEAEKHILGESHLLKGFVRFSDYGNFLAAQITPKNFVLPFIAEHFCERYPEENLLIFDKNHKAALIKENGEAKIIPLESIELPEMKQGEEKYRELWKHFYNTVAIEARTNPRCRMTLMPKRYWENMLEVQDLL